MWPWNKKEKRKKGDVLIIVINDTRDRVALGFLLRCEIDDRFVGHRKFMCGHRGIPGERALFKPNKQVCAADRGNVTS